ncbi:TPR repeat-containing protein [Oleidesulfovibrio alaskensis G20]|jgi:tetratricopeptide (TPR) repeat protein|uniref:TPR repeat-containing protein n=1 Tax=Oleidesulfovibrio alaskensis (strain ATCC BAA-1058 / DSM 17464 / G20) TaxID=207559 RepID=Q313C7_OLEA2|nr:tetratricopeptide repeat protein [Oleidesulfovibrio alaskensis]ABB37969.1 TPR repeat-containing protein [Oleidesulfovibrio alaskensis G20]MBG0772886.1 tetratricopeptide repeat protein [Oleidesulfovibrio alaskensis]MBL3582558.1 tetratricopeptide repeat protein [Oleidesulfovibrio alaskensis]
MTAHKTALLLTLCAALLLTACGGREEPELPRFNPMGMSGTHSQDAEKWYAMAHVLWKDNTCSDPEKAVEYLNKALEAEPDYAEALLRRGLAYSEQKRWEKAFDDMTQAVRLKPSAESYTWRGLVMLRMGNAIGAVRDTTRALEYDTAYNQAWNIRGGAKLVLGDAAGACSDFENGCSTGDCTGLESARRQNICP